MCAPATAQGGQAGGQRRVLQWWPCLQQLRPTFLVAWASSTNLPGCGTLPPATPGHLPTSHSGPLPGSTLQTPLSSTQPFSPPGDTQPRLGCVGAWHRPHTQAPPRPYPHTSLQGTPLTSRPLKVPPVPADPPATSVSP